MVAGERPGPSGLAARPAHLTPRKTYGPARSVSLVRSLAVVALIVLAGCAGTPLSLPTVSAGPPALPTQWDVDADGCLTAASFFLVEPTRAHAYLPPGFYAADLSEFLYNTPVTSAKIPAFVAASTCSAFNITNPDTHERRFGALEVVYVGFFIHPPEFATAYANRPSDYNFYAVSFLTPLETGSPATRVPSDMVAAYGWNQTQASVDFMVKPAAQGAPAGHPLISDRTNNTLVPDRYEKLQASGLVTMQGAPAFRFKTDALFPQAFDTPPKLRFWQAAPAGMGFMEFLLPQRTVMAGPLLECWMQEGTLIHEIAAERHAFPEGDPDQAELCGLIDSFGLVFDHHRLVGQLHHLDGVFPV